MYSAINLHRKTGEEQIIDEQGQCVSSLSDFWKWAYSDLISNAERGVLAEYIVACALGIADKIRVSWDRYDLEMPNGVSIEVKTAGYVQTWQQEELSKIVFSIRPTYGWDSKKNEYGKILKRQAKVYVFCLHRHTEKATINPLDLSQWEFYLLSTAAIDEKLENQRTVTLNRLKKCGAVCCGYKDLKQRIDELV